MLVNKIDAGLNKTTFKGFEHKKNDYGKTVPVFNFPFDYSNRFAYLELLKVKKDSNFYGGYSIDRNFKPVEVELKRSSEGTPVDVQQVLGLRSGEGYAYRIKVQNEAPKADTGMQITETVRDGDKSWNETYTLVPRNGTTPMSRNGLGYITMVDTHLPGAYYYGFESDKTGEIEYNPDLQYQREKIKRNSSNKIGGTLAGLEYDAKNLRNKGVTTLYVTPIAGGDDLSYHRYWNKNNFQIADEVGNINNFKSFARTLYKNGMTYVFDGTFTSEGTEGVNVQYALKWAHQKPGALYRFRMDGIENGPVGLGIIPKKSENLRYKLVNTPYVLVKNSKGKADVVQNPEYQSNKPSYIQVYDATLVTAEQANSPDLITGYGAPNIADKLAFNTYQDSIIPQKNRIYDLVSYKETLENAAKFINSKGGDFELNTPEVALLVSKTPTFEFAKKNKNVGLWEDKFGMFIRRHNLSGVDEKNMMSILSDADREEVRQRLARGANENIDMDAQTVRYWTGLYKDTLTYYTAQTLGNVKDVNGIKALIDKGLLPEEVMLTENALKNIENEIYYLEPKGVLERNDVTVKALMKLPLASLEFDEEIVSILQQSFFTNLAPSKEFIGKTRFELEQMGNPHLIEPDTDIYLKANSLFTQDVKNFADEIIKKIDENSSEKLITEKGEYTEYGEYVIEHIGQDIARYAFLKSLVGSDFIGKYSKVMDKTGIIEYDFQAIRQVTNPQNIGLNEGDMYSEANALYNKIHSGMRKLDNNDVEFLSNAFVKQLQGTNTMSFRISEAMYEKASLGMDWRIDAAKDVIDVDSTKQLMDSFDRLWQNAIGYYIALNSAIKLENPNSKITGEITDMGKMASSSWGESTDMGNYNALKDAKAEFKGVQDAMRRFWMESGMTTEAGYEHFFSSIFRTFSLDFEQGVKMNNAVNEIADVIERLIKERGVDYIRNMLAFVGNHDKPRVVHYAALDLNLFYNGFGLYDDKGKYNSEIHKGYRETAMKLISGVDKLEDMPLEFRLNVNNADYFRTISSRAVAMSSLIKTGIDEAGKDKNGKDIVNEKAKKYFRLALKDLTEGRYLDFGPKVDRETIKTKELRTLNGAADAIIKIAEDNYGLKLSEEKRGQMVEWAAGYANDNKNLYRYLVQNERQEDIDKNKSILNDLFNTEDKAEKAKQRNFEEYSLYTICLSGLMKEALNSAFGDDNEAKDKIAKALRDYVNKYDKKYLDENSTVFPYSESAKDAGRKNGYAVKEFEETLFMMLEHAEYLARNAKDLKDGETFENMNQMIEAIYKAMHEPAMNKSINMTAMLATLPVIATLYHGDEFGMTGGEEKSNNVYNENRNARRIEETRRGFLKEYRQKQEAAIDAARRVKTVQGAEALNVGTPYRLYTNVDQTAAWLMQSNDSEVISIVHNGGVDPYNHRKGRDENVTVTINDIVFPKGLMLPKGTKFKNISVKDGEEYVIDEYESDGQWYSKLVPVGAAAICMTKENSLNGTKVLKRIFAPPAVKKAVAKAVSMKGRSNNGQYYISTPLYNGVSKEVKEGEKLSIIAE